MRVHILVDAGYDRFTVVREPDFVQEYLLISAFFRYFGFFPFDNGHRSWYDTFQQLNHAKAVTGKSRRFSALQGESVVDWKRFQGLTR
ncbi:hypothetical protein Daudx_1923 [Candidatus Desulforudis audaxviator]|nr:hypothetical protein Daudx_1923 [Candidatus Desulforudis audaxviator]